MAYTKQKHIDHILDQQGQIVQQGTPYSAGRLNNMEGGIASAAVLSDNNAEVIREAIPSGLAKLSVIDPTYSKTNPNKLKLTGGGAAFVNGFKVAIPDGTIITLDAPPAEGAREDLVFLEVWRAQQTDTVGDVISSRIRVKAGIDFATYSEGINHTALVKAWGGNVADTTYTFSKSTVDLGLYTSGTGNQASKDALKTADGYVYAIPLFRVKRRNTGAYSVVNPNGSPTYLKPAFSMRTGTYVAPYTGTGTWTLTESLDYDKISVGDLFTNDAINNIVKVLSKDGGNNITVTYVKSNAFPFTLATGNSTFYRLASTAEQLLSDVIDDRDILDLRHQVSLTGFNYQALLEENFDRLLRGDLQTKERKKMVKTYHGIRKTPIDANVVVTASLDSTVTAEVGSIYTNNLPSPVQYIPMATGAGVHLSNTKMFYCDIAAGNGALTAEAWLNTDDMWTNAASYRALLWFKTAANGLIAVCKGSGTNQFRFLWTNSLINSFTVVKPRTRFTHVRVTLVANALSVYFNGVLVQTGITPAGWDAAQITKAGCSDTPSGYGYVGAISDFSVSNIDRGAVFATLPADFIAGYAVVGPSMNSQRKTHSDAVSGQATSGIAKGAGAAHSKGITKVQATPDTWAENDTVKVKGLAGEIISGVIDTDTALAEITSIVQTGSTTQIFEVKSAAGLAVDDVVYFAGREGVISYAITITAIDGLKVTGSTSPHSPNVSSYTSLFLVESTASSSSPTAKFMNAGTLTTVVGTWSGLATNEATFTLGVNAALVNADLEIGYSLNMPAGQGGVPEVYTATLEGSAKGKKLVIGSTVAVDDFIGKVSGSITENPQLAKKKAAATLQAPTDFATEFTQGDYDNAANLDGLNASMTTSVNGEIAQQLFSLDLIKLIEAKYGAIPSVDKVAWFKANFASVYIRWRGYGSGPNGNIAKVAFWSGSAWASELTHNAGAASLLSRSITASLSTAIDTDGKVHFLAYTDASNGAIASTIYTDSVSFEILNPVTPTGYDLLVPENARRDDGLTNVLLVRKETKEVKSFFDAVNTDDLVTYGDYVPYQGLTAASGRILASLYDIICTTAGTGGVASVTNRKVLSHMLPKYTGVYDYLLTQAPVVLTDDSTIANASNIRKCGKVSTLDSALTSGIGDITAGLNSNVAADLKNSVPHLDIEAALVNVSNELLLRLSTTFKSSAQVGKVGSAVIEDMKLIGRPLSKGV